MFVSMGLGQLLQCNGPGVKAPDLDLIKQGFFVEVRQKFFVALEIDDALG